jgi:predicted nuclease of predicted toxin-antitoxin system
MSRCLWQRLAEVKTKLDENLPEDLVGPLTLLGHDVDTVKQEGLSGEADPKVWEVAQQEGRLFVTQDLFFTDTRNHPPGSHAGVLLLRFPQTGRRQAVARILQIFQTHNIEQWKGCNVVANENHVRVRGGRLN